MARGSLDKISLLSKIYKMKHNLYEKLIYQDWTREEKKAAQTILNDVLDFVNEYSR
jgi:hypothetical protein